jgi:hypothetical protein
VEIKVGHLDSGVSPSSRDNQDKHVSGWADFNVIEPELILV